MTTDATKVKYYDSRWYGKLAAWEASAAVAQVYWTAGQPTAVVAHFDAASWDTTAAEINEWHRQRNFYPRGSGPYPYMGYHYLVRRAGDVQVGRTLDVIGTHCLGWNDRALGICLSGGLMGDYPTPAQKNTLAQLCAALMKRFAIPLERYYHHRELNSTNCPGGLNKLEMIDKIRGYATMPKIEVKQYDRVIEKGYYRGLAIVDCFDAVSSAAFEVKFPEGCGFTLPPDFIIHQANGANYGAITGSQDVSKDRAICTIIEKADVVEQGGKITVNQPKLKTVGLLVEAKGVPGGY